MNPTGFNSAEGNKTPTPSPREQDPYTITRCPCLSLNTNTTSPLEEASHLSEVGPWDASLQSKCVNHTADMMHALLFNFAVKVIQWLQRAGWSQLNKHLSHPHYKSWELEGDFDIPEMRWERYLVGHRVPWESSGCFKENFLIQTCINQFWVHSSAFDFNQQTRSGLKYKDGKWL